MLQIEACLGVFLKPSLNRGEKMATTANDTQNKRAYGLLSTVAGREGDSACQLTPLRALESKQLKLSVTVANIS